MWDNDRNWVFFFLLMFFVSWLHLYNVSIDLFYKKMLKKTLSLYCADFIINHIMKVFDKELISIDASSIIRCTHFHCVIHNYLHDHFKVTLLCFYIVTCLLASNELLGCIALAFTQFDMTLKCPLTSCTNLLIIDWIVGPLYYMLMMSKICGAFRCVPTVGGYCVTFSLRYCLFWILVLTVLSFLKRHLLKRGWVRWHYKT